MNKPCPQCDGEIVLRHSKKGDFYGCSNYPDCKYTEKIEKKTFNQPTNDKQVAINKASELKADTILITASLKNAIEYSQGKDVKPELILTYADKFYDWMYNKAKGNGHTKPTTQEIKDKYFPTAKDVTPTNPDDAPLNKKQQDKILLLLRERDLGEITYQIIGDCKGIGELTYGEGKQILEKLIKLNEIADTKK